MCNVMILSRRKILTGLLAAPAVIAVHKLMPVKFIDFHDPRLVRYKGASNFDGGLFYCPNIPEWYPPAGLNIGILNQKMKIFIDNKQFI